MARIEFDDDAIAKLHQAVNAHAHDIVRQVNAEASGQPVNDVLAVLRSRLREAGMEPDDERSAAVRRSYLRRHSD